MYPERLTLRDFVLSLDTLNAYRVATNWVSHDSILIKIKNDLIASTLWALCEVCEIGDVDCAMNKARFFFNYQHDRPEVDAYKESFYLAKLCLRVVSLHLFSSKLLLSDPSETDVMQLKSKIRLIKHEAIGSPLLLKAISNLISRTVTLATKLDMI